MEDFQIVLAALTSVILFLFGLEHFSKEIQRISGNRFRKALSNVTKYPFLGVLIGAIVTGLIQSSSATSVIAISLVNAGVLSFKNSVGIIFGSNVGTTVTAQLVALKLTNIGPYFLIFGFLLSLIRSKYSVFGKSLFYFGFVFFALNLISSSLAPLNSDERIIHFLTSPHNILVGIGIGTLVTAIIQSSSVTTGLTIILSQQGLISLENAIPILMGANIGTTVTALIAILNMDISAKKTALTHLLFNVGGVLLFLPIVAFYGDKMPLFSEDPTIALANFHLIFNLTTTFFFSLFLGPFSSFIDKILGEGVMDFERLNVKEVQESKTYEEIEKVLINHLENMFSFLQENFNLVTLSLETNYKGISVSSQKRIEYFDYLKNEYMDSFPRAMELCTTEEQKIRIIKLMGLYEYLFQISDSVKELKSIKNYMDENYIEFKSDSLNLLRELSSHYLTFFRKMGQKVSEEQETKEIKKDILDLQSLLEDFHKIILKIMKHPERRDAGIILQIITNAQRLKDKLVSYHKLLLKGPF